MLPSEANIIQNIASVMTNPTTYIILTLLIAFLIYFFKLLDFFELPNSYKMLIALILPIALMEFILTFIFGFVGIQLNWGRYVYHFPYFGDFVVTSGVQLSKFLDFVFNFGVFREFGNPYFMNFVNSTQIPVTVIPPDFGLWGLIKVIFSSGFNLFVWIWVSADSIIDLIFFFVLFSALLAILAENLPSQKAYAFGLAWIPVIFYSYFISNPFKEYPEALVGLERVFYFWSHGDNWSLLVFFSTLIFSFLIVMEIIAMTVHLFLKGGSMTLQPGWQSKEWEISQHGIAFGYTLAFAIMYSLHEYSWYVVFPFLVAYTALKRVGGVAIDSAHAHAERQEMRDLISGINPQNNYNSIKSSGKNSSMEWILYAGVVLLVIVLLINNGIL